MFVVCAHHAPRQKKHGRTCGVRRAFHPTTATLRDSADAGTPRVHPRLRRHRLPPCRASRRCVRQCELLCAGKQCIPTNLFVFCSMASHAGSITRTVRRAARSHTTPARPTASCTRTVLRDWQLCSTHTARRSVRDTSLHTTAPSTCGRPMLHSLCTPSASAPMCSARSARATASQCTPVLSANGWLASTTRRTLCHMPCHTCARRPTSGRSGTRWLCVLPRLLILRGAACSCRRRCSKHRPSSLNASSTTLGTLLTRKLCWRICDVVRRG